jgi:luciferase family oxidoreductase group 1
MVALSVLDLSFVTTGTPPSAALRNTLDLAQVADRLGYLRYWTAEHHNLASVASPAPEVMIGQIAAVTKRIRVGSGGVMLPNHAPLAVAERFKMLEALFPGRIDLGIGRAPGGDARAVMALGYGRSISIEHFPEQVAELIGWLENSYDKRHPWGRVRALPRGDTVPPVWLLGSGGQSGTYAAELGCGYTFAQFISGEDGARAVRGYRDRFRPSRHFPEPRASLAIGVVCADTEEEAIRLSSSLELWRRRLSLGRDRGIPSPAEALAELGEGWRPPDLGTNGARAVIGDPAQVAAELRRLAAHYEVDEVMTVTVTHDFAARLHSYRLLAAALL